MVLFAFIFNLLAEFDHNRIKSASTAVYSQHGKEIETVYVKLH